MTSTSFDDYFAEIEAEARAEGPDAVRDLEAKRLKYRLINLLLTRRGELHLTQQQLAERSGVAQTEISRIERGRKSPTLDTYSRLASALDLEWVEPQRRATA
ncbi:MAG: helix-turn-helix transcriptional regulator [Candidatus Dormibacteria bacterium]